MILQGILKHYSNDPNSSILNSIHIAQYAVYFIYLRIYICMYICSGENTLDDIIMTLL